MEDKKRVSNDCAQYFNAFRRATAQKYHYEATNKRLVECEQMIADKTANFADTSKVWEFVRSEQYKSMAAANAKAAAVLDAFISFLSTGATEEPTPAPATVPATTTEETPADRPAPATTSTRPANAAATTDKARALSDIMSALSGLCSVDMEQIDARISEHVSAALKDSVREIVIKNGDRPAIKVDGAQCDNFDFILNIVNNGIGVYLVGPAGTGKSYTAGVIANALGYSVEQGNYYPVPKVTYAEQLTGYMDANGNYVEGVMYKAMKQGALLFVDELDASDAAALVAINTAIANRVYTFPNCEVVKASDSFKVIAAGNTYGNGADNLYTGRNAIDASTLDRFMTLRVDYNRAVEMAQTGNNAALVDYVHDVRRAANACALDFVCSYRALQNIAIMETVTDNLPLLVQAAIIKGLCKEDARRLYNALDDKGNKYARAMYTAVDTLAC